MPAPENPSPDQHDAPLPSVLGGLNPDELFARGMQSVRMTGGGSMQNWEPPTVAEAARLFPNYRVVDVLGRGGMGAVYKAVQTALDRVVAIKLLPLEISIDRDFADRFVREARTMAKLNHPNIVSVFDFGTTTEGHLYFVMEFVEGTTLHQLIKTTGLKPLQALELIVNVCEALQYAHGEGVVHRDIKPANVLVDTKGRVKVADFGLARMDTPSAEQWGQTMTGVVMGTPDYMAPEQKSGARVDHRADIYSLGVMLYEMLCGQVPQGIFAPPSQRVSVDERVDQVVIRAMQQEPNRRYANTAEMKSEVESIRHTPVPVTATSDVQKIGTPVPDVGPVAAASALQTSPEAKPAKSATPWLVGIAALCAVVAVSAVLIQSMHVRRPEMGSFVPPPAPELVSLESAARQAAEESAATAAIADMATTESARTEPALSVADSSAPPAEPPVPVPAPLVEAPVAAMAPPPVAAPAAAQITPPPVATTALTPVAPAAAPVAAAMPATRVEAALDPEDTLTQGEDWRRYVAAGDSLMNRRQRDEAIDSYLTAFDLATDGRPITAVEVAALCRKTANLQIGLGSRAEARLTLERGRTTLKRMNNPKEAVERQRSLEQIESQLISLPRD